MPRVLVEHLTGPPPQAGPRGLDLARIRYATVHDPPAYDTFVIGDAAIFVLTIFVPPARPQKHASNLDERQPADHCMFQMEALS